MEDVGKRRTDGGGRTDRRESRNSFFRLNIQIVTEGSLLGFTQLSDNT